MDDNFNHNHGPGNGFLMGVIVGAAATLLFTTKKGREIVKEIADRGFERISEWEDSMGQEVIVDEEDDYIEPVEVERLKLAKPTTSSTSNSVKSNESFSNKPHHEKIIPHKGKANFRRFFKDSKKS